MPDSYGPSTITQKTTPRQEQATSGPDDPALCRHGPATGHLKNRTDMEEGDL